MFLNGKRALVTGSTSGIGLAIDRCHVLHAGVVDQNIDRTGLCHQRLDPGAL